MRLFKAPLLAAAIACLWSGLACAQSATTVPLKNGSGATVNLAVQQDASSNVHYRDVMEGLLPGGAPQASTMDPGDSGLWMHVTNWPTLWTVNGTVTANLGTLGGAATASNQSTQIAAEQATAATLGTTADSPYSGTGNATNIATQKGLYNQLVAILTQLQSTLNVACSGCGGGGAAYGPNATGITPTFPPLYVSGVDPSGHVDGIHTDGSHNVNVDVQAGTLTLAGSVTANAPGFPSTSTPGTITTGGTFQTALAASSNRHGCLVVNPSTATEVLYVFFGTTGSATTGASIPVGVGGTVSCNFLGGVATDNIAVEAATTSHAYAVISQ